jgi:hypothetical protein
MVGEGHQLNPPDTANGAPTKKVHRPNHLSFHDAGSPTVCRRPGRCPSHILSPPQRTEVAPIPSVRPASPSQFTRPTAGSASPERQRHIKPRKSIPLIAVSRRMCWSARCRKRSNLDNFAVPAGSMAATHVAMFALALRQRDRREALGQVPWIVVAAFGSVSASACSGRKQHRYACCRCESDEEGGPPDQGSAH